MCDIVYCYGICACADCSAGGLQLSGDPSIMTPKNVIKNSTRLRCGLEGAGVYYYTVHGA